MGPGRKAGGFPGDLVVQEAGKAPLVVEDLGDKELKARGAWEDVEEDGAFLEPCGGMEPPRVCVASVELRARPRA